jgi:tight adherence protein B
VGDGRLNLVGSACLLLAAVLAWPTRRPWLPAVDGSVPGHRAGGRATESAGWLQPALPVPVVLELVCAALEAGLATSAAVQAALALAGGPTAQAHLLLGGWGGAAGTRRSDVVAAPWLPLARALDLADRTGASAAVLLRGAAADERARRRRRAQVRAGRLGVQLVVPLGLTVLPAFVLLGVAPVVLGLASAAIGLR